MEQLDDLDFADNLCLMSYSHKEEQETIDKMEKYGKKIGLKINKEKNAVMINLKV